MIMFNLFTIGMLVYREVILPICSLQWKHLLLQFENVVVEFFGVIIFICIVQCLLCNS